MSGTAPLTNLRTFDLDSNSSVPGSQERDVPAGSQRLCDLQSAHDAEKFKLTLKLREEETQRLALIAKVGELERAKLRLEKELFESSNDSALRLQVELLQDENRTLKASQRCDCSERDSESRLEVEQLRTQLRLLDLELDSKRDTQQALATLQLEARKLRKELAQVCEKLSDSRREITNYQLENQRLMSENAQMMQRLQGQSAIMPQDYALLQQRLEATTRRIQMLESLVKENSENYEKLKELAASEARRSKSKDRGKRRKSKVTLAETNADPGKKDRKKPSFKGWE